MFKLIFYKHLWRFAGIGSALLLGAVRPGWGAAFERDLVFEADELRLANLVGSVQVVGYAGSEIRGRRPPIFESGVQRMERLDSECQGNLANP